MVETVLSSTKFQLPVLRALKAGFEFGFVYVTVRSADLNVERVADRVAEGGHDVPEDRIRARRVRSAEAVAWFAARATQGLVVDNTASDPLLLAEKKRGEPNWLPAQPELLRILGLFVPT